MCTEYNEVLETTQHISAGCKNLAPKECLLRHNQLARTVHHKLATKNNFTEDDSAYCKHVPTNILESDNYRLVIYGSVRFPMVSLEFFIDILAILSVALWPWVCLSL
jgi:hypothetical protein